MGSFDVTILENGSSGAPVSVPVVPRPFLD
jgi:hypothetical protein